MLAAFGGLNGFLDQWRNVVGRDLQTGGYAAFRHLESVIRLMQYYDHLRPTKADYSRMTDEELLAAMSTLTDPADQ
jgi:hypothetical protein